MPKPTDAETVAVIHRLCAASDLMHIETAKLVVRLLEEPRVAASATPRKRTPPHTRPKRLAIAAGKKK